MDTRSFIEGRAKDAYKFFGNHKKTNNSYIFRSYAPNARNVYVIGDFNGWKEEKLRKYSTGVFSKTIKKVNKFDKYLFVIEDNDGNKSYKLDPFAKLCDLENQSSLVFDEAFKFSYKIKENNKINIYQVNFENLDREIFENKKKMDSFIQYLKNNNFTHLNFMPIFSNRIEASLGFAPSSFFALNENFTSINNFKSFIDLCHKNNIGIILDFDIGEFDPFNKGLIKFDGSNLYNYDYDDILYNYQGSVNMDPKKDIVKSFIFSLISYWIDEYNIDGIKFANLENMVFWQGDKARGYNEYWLDLLKDINLYIKSLGKISIGSFYYIWKNEFDEDLGFSYIYDRTFSNLIKIMQKYPYQRDNYSTVVENIIRGKYEKYILGFDFSDSLSEGASLCMKMYSDNKKYQQLKTLFLLLYSLSSKKMIFMEDEIGSLKSFDISRKVDFNKINKEEKDFNEFYKGLSKFYQDHKNLYKKDAQTKILEIEGYSLYAFIREYKKEKYLVLINLTDLDYKIDLDFKFEKILTSFDGKYKEDDKIKIPAFGSGIFRIK